MEPHTVFLSRMIAHTAKLQEFFNSPLKAGSRHYTISSVVEEHLQIMRRNFSPNYFDSHDCIKTHQQMLCVHRHCRLLCRRPPKGHHELLIMSWNDLVLEHLQTTGRIEAFGRGCHCMGGNKAVVPLHWLCLPADTNDVTNDQVTWSDGVPSTKGGRTGQLPQRAVRSVQCARYAV